MAVPKKRHSTHRKGRRRAAKKLSLPFLGKCSNCQQPVKPHIVCLNCGYYKGKDMLNLEKKHEKKRRSKTSKTDSNR